MKNYAFLAILAILLTYLMITGFQCASSEMTSAKLYISRSDWASAEKALLKEVEKNPKNGEAWWLLGHTYTSEAKFAEAVSAFDNSLKNTNEFAEKITQSKKYIWGQCLNLGVANYNKSLSVSADSSAMYRKRAIEYYTVALRVNADSIITYQNQALAQRAGGSYADEIATLTEALKHKQSMNLYISLIDAYLTLGQNAEAKGDKDEAKVNYNKAIDAIMEARKIEPENEELLATMINIYVSQGRANEAKPYMREAIGKNPTNKVYQYNLGVLLMQTDSLEEAISHFDAALNADPVYDVALQNAGVAYMRIGDRIKQAAQAGDAKNIDNKAYLVKFKKASEYFKKLTEVKPEDSNAFDLLASAYANSNMVAEAKAALEKADSLRKK